MKDQLEVLESVNVIKYVCAFSKKIPPIYPHAKILTEVKVNKLVIIVCLLIHKHHYMHKTCVYFHIIRFDMAAFNS